MSSSLGYECKDGVTAKLYAGDLVYSCDVLDSLKHNMSISTFELVVPASASFQDASKTIDRVADILKARCNIKRFKVQLTDWTAKIYLLATLAHGHAGENLEDVWITGGDREAVSMGEAYMLQKYLERNRTLSRLAIGLRSDPGSLQLLSNLSDCSSVVHLHLEVWPCGRVQELGALIGKCSFVASLCIHLCLGQTLDDVGAFFIGVAKMPRLTWLEIILDDNISPLIVDAIGSLVVQRGTLEHFSICLSSTPNARCCLQNWVGLGVALRSVKGVILELRSENAFHAVLPHLQSCESLELPCRSNSLARFGLTGSILSRLPKLRVIDYGGHPHGNEDAFLDMIKASDSITNVRFVTFERGTTASNLAKIRSFGNINRVFGTGLVGFNPTDLWTRILSKIDDDSARATLLYRLLLEKPELVMQRAIRFSRNTRE